ncbi:hypothetical protein ACFRKE_10690 [Kitasatospora indigofera]|uniref:hypothetical protein n=1 Tax=Kitasatospora indigofera TaxID=67307 RepID=UPI00368C9394
MSTAVAVAPRIEGVAQGGQVGEGGLFGEAGEEAAQGVFVAVVDGFGEGGQQGRPGARGMGGGCARSWCRLLSFHLSVLPFCCGVGRSLFGPKTTFPSNSEKSVLAGVDIAECRG